MADSKNYITNKYMVMFPKDIKQEYDVDIEIKTECHIEPINEGVNVKEECEDLYQDHVIKEELVIGPEVIQETHTNDDSIAIEVACETIEEFNGLKCENCGTNFQTKKELTKHKRTCIYVCHYCRKGFESHTKIIEHLKSCTCTFCGKHFSFSSNLSRHVKTHTGVRKHTCTQCTASFVRKDYLVTHMYRKHGSKQVLIKKPSTCQLCNKEFSSKNSRNIHLKFACPKNNNKIEPKKDKWYECDVCNKGYPYRSSLTAHINFKHMGVTWGKIHECDYCGKKYVKKQNLRCHIQAKHMNLKPYSCKVCRETFTWHCMWATHVRRYHDKGGSKK